MFAHFFPARKLTIMDRPPHLIPLEFAVYSNPTRRDNNDGLSVSQQL